MPQIRIYRFRPTSKPPPKIGKLYPWFKKEVVDAAIEPVDSYEIPEKGPINGSGTHLPLANKLLKGFRYFKKAYTWFKKRS